MDVFGSKPQVRQSYAAYEERFLREANKKILQDDGLPEIMKVMSREFIEMIQGCLTIKGDVVPPSDGDVNDYMRVMHQGEDVTVSLKDYCRQIHSSKIMPDLDLDKVMISKKNLLNEFTNMYSVFVEEIDLSNKRAGTAKSGERLVTANSNQRQKQI